MSVRKNSSYVLTAFLAILVAVAAAATTTGDHCGASTTNSGSGGERYCDDSATTNYTNNYRHYNNYNNNVTEDSAAATVATTTVKDTNNAKNEKNTVVPVPDSDVVGYPVSRYCEDRRTIDFPDIIRPEHNEKQNNSNPLGVSDTEWFARVELAAAYRALYLLGHGSDQAAQCLMLRVPTSDDDDDDETSSKATSFLMADWGVWFEDVTASNLLHFTIDGERIYPPSEKHDGTSKSSSPLRANTGCIPVAKAIFEARSDVNTIVHIHPYAVMAVSGMKVGLLPLSQASFFLWGQISREEYDFTYENSFETTLANGFNKGQRAMLLNHHGMYAVGRDVAEAIFVATHITQACEVQIRTLSMAGGDLNKVILPSGKDLSNQYKDMMDSTDYCYDGSREWPGILRKVLREAPDFNS